jgi:hypothetical protein
VAVTGVDTSLKPRPSRGFVVFRWLVYGLLAADIALYARFGRTTELVDTAAWFVLLMLFEWETGGWRMSERARVWVHVVRVLAGLAVALAVAGYAWEREWLDFANEAVWLAVIVMLEVEVRVPSEARELHRWRRWITTLLYAALVAFMLAWLADGLVGDKALHALLDAGDALLWLVAFATIELNVFGMGPGRDAKRARAAQPTPRS